MNIYSIHSHGIHISGIQDNVFESLYPGAKHTDTWTIHPDHHLGTSWYGVFCVCQSDKLLQKMFVNNRYQIQLFTNVF